LTDITICSKGCHFPFIENNHLTNILVQRIKIVVLNVKDIDRVAILVVGRDFARKRVVAKHNCFHATLAQTGPLLRQRAIKFVVVHVQNSETAKVVIAFDPIVGNGTGEGVVAQIQVMKVAEIQILGNTT